MQAAEVQQPIAASAEGGGARWWIGLLAGSGILATVLGFGLPKVFGPAADKVAELRGESSLKVHIDADGRFVPVESSLWALADSDPRVGGDSTAGLRAAGAVAVHRTIVAVTVENVWSRQVTVTSIRAVVESPRRDPLAGALVRVAPGGGGTEPPPVNLGFALDTGDLEARVVTDGQPGATHYVDQHGVTLKPGEQLRLRMAGHSRAHHVAWSAVVRYVVDGEPHDTPIGTAGQFQVTGARSSYPQAYELSTSTFRAVPVADLCGADCRTLRQ